MELALQTLKYFFMQLNLKKVIEDHEPLETKGNQTQKCLMLGLFEIIQARVSTRYEHGHTGMESVPNTT